MLLALLPVVLIIGLGHLLRRHAFLGEGFWPGAERLCYFVLLPSLFLQGLAAARLEALPVPQLAGTLVLSTFAVAVLLVAVRPLLPVNGAAFTSVFQGSIRFNNYIAITLAAGLFGAEGVALAAICNAAIVPTVNVLCILVFGRFGEARLSAAGIARQIATNPLVLACAGGILFQATGTTLPTGLDPALRALGAASLPLGLLCVGAALDFRTARSWIGPVAGSSAVRFLAVPLATVVAALTFRLEGAPLVVALLFQTMPTASSAYILARQLGGDAPLMAGIIAVQTLLAALAIPLVLAALVAFGLA
ncbi:AEC family transporter [Roseomonas sp. GCM10028921]